MRPRADLASRAHLGRATVSLVNKYRGHFTDRKPLAVAPSAKFPARPRPPCPFVGILPFYSLFGKLFAIFVVLVFRSLRGPKRKGTGPLNAKVLSPFF